MRLERGRRRVAQGWGSLEVPVVPRAVEQLVARTRARAERLEDEALALEPVFDVLVELAARVPHDGPVARQDRLGVELAQPAQRRKVCRQRALAGGDEDASRA